MPTLRLKAHSGLAIISGVASAAVVSVTIAADPGGTVRIRPGLWDTSSQIWIDGKHVLRGPESAADRAMREAQASARAQMTAEERATIDRIMPPSNSVLRATQCVTAAVPSINTRAALSEALQSLHASPWTCAYNGEQGSSRGYFLNYTCTTPADGRAEGKAVAMVNGDGAYTLSLEGRAHAVDGASGRPLESRMVETRVLADGVWKAEQC
jgi:hypothetical protein